jgi:hypothetical protein
MEKRCSKCGITKLFSEFTCNNNRPDKLTVWCKACSKESRDAYYSKNKDSIKVKHLEWREKNKESIKLKKIEKRKEDPRKIMLYSAKHRAQQRGLPFNIELDDIVIPEYCPVLHMKLELYNETQSRSSPSLDRINSKLGYTKDNIQVISWLANTMKTNASAKELLLFAEWVLNNFKDKDE